MQAAGQINDMAKLLSEQACCPFYGNKARLQLWQDSEGKSFPLSETQPPGINFSSLTAVFVFALGRCPVSDVRLILFYQQLSWGQPFSF